MWKSDVFVLWGETEVLGYKLCVNMEEQWNFTVGEPEIVGYKLCVNMEQ
jgi:hypothetical protein